MKCLVTLISVAMFALSVTPALAQTDARLENCTEQQEGVSRAQLIEFCSELIAEIEKSGATQAQLLQLYTERFFAYLRKDQYRLALVDLLKMHDLGPDQSLVVLNYFSDSLKRDLKDDLSEILAITGSRENDTRDLYPLMDLRAWAEMKLGNHDRAIADYSAAVELDPFRVDGLQKRAEAFVEIGQADLALADLEDIIKISEPGSEAYLERFTHLSKEPGFDDAGFSERFADYMKDARQAALVGWLEIVADTNQLRQGIDSVERLIPSAPSLRVSLMLHQAGAYAELKEYDAVVEHLESGIAIFEAVGCDGVDSLIEDRMSLIFTLYSTYGTVLRHHVEDMEAAIKAYDASLAYATEDFVVKLQDGAKIAGYYAGPVDGKVSAEFRRGLAECIRAEDC